MRLPEAARVPVPGRAVAPDRAGALGRMGAQVHPAAVPGRAVAPDRVGGRDRPVVPPDAWEIGIVERQLRIERRSGSSSGSSGSSSGSGPGPDGGTCTSDADCGTGERCGFLQSGRMLRDRNVLSDARRHLQRHRPRMCVRRHGHQRRLQRPLPSGYTPKPFAHSGTCAIDAGGASSGSEGGSGSERRERRRYLGVRAVLLRRRDRILLRVGRRRPPARRGEQLHLRVQPDPAAMPARPHLRVRHRRRRGDPRLPVQRPVGRRTACRVVCIRESGHFAKRQIAILSAPAHPFLKDKSPPVNEDSPLVAPKVYRARLGRDSAASHRFLDGTLAEPPSGARAMRLSRLLRGRPLAFFGLSVGSACGGSTLLTPAGPASPMPAPTSRPSPRPPSKRALPSSTRASMVTRASSFRRPRKTPRPTPRPTRAPTRKTTLSIAARAVTIAKGAACVAGTCGSAPRVLASGQAPTFIAVDAENVYWDSNHLPQPAGSAGHSQVMRCAIRGCDGRAHRPRGRARRRRGSPSNKGPYGGRPDRWRSTTPQKRRT